MNNNTKSRIVVAVAGVILIAGAGVLLVETPASAEFDVCQPMTWDACGPLYEKPRPVVTVPDRPAPVEPPAPVVAPANQGGGGYVAPAPKRPAPKYVAPKRTVSTYRWCGKGQWWERDATGGRRPGYTGKWKIVKRYGCETRTR